MTTAEKGFVPTLFSIVTVVDADDKTEKDYLVNYSHHETKLWFTKTLIWALNNDKMITIEAATMDQLATRSLFIPRT